MKSLGVVGVLNLIISGMPSIPPIIKNFHTTSVVLNLIISGMPSILQYCMLNSLILILSFKPYYKWNAFNTLK